MTREQIKEQFPDATEEQISALLDINGADVTKAKKNNVDPKELKRLQGIEAEYKKLQDADLTDAEKIQRALEDAANSKLEYDKKSNKLDAEKILVAAGLTDEDYKDLIDGIVSDNAETTKTMATNLATLIRNQKESAVQKAKEEMMDGTNTRGGGSGGDEGEEKTPDIEFAEKAAESRAAADKSASEGLSRFK